MGNRNPEKGCSEWEKNEFNVISLANDLYYLNYV